MKKLDMFRYMLLVVFAVTMFACEDDEYDRPNDLSDVKWIHDKIGDIYDPADTLIKIAQDDQVTFADLSQGALSHNWTIPSNSFFLSMDFEEDEFDLTPYIIEGAGIENKDGKVSVLFANSGKQGVRLYNTFKDSVMFLGGNNRASVYNETEDVWVIDTTFMVDVYGHPKPAFKVCYVAYDNTDSTTIIEVGEDQEVSIDDADSWPTIEVMSGGRLRYVDLTKNDRVDSREWGINVAGTIETKKDSAIDMQYFLLGSGNVGTLLSKRDNVDEPRDATMKFIPLKVKVIESDLPFEIVGKSNVIEEDVILFNVSGVVTSIPLDEAANFTVNVINEAAGYNENIPVSSVKKVNGDETAIELKLDGRLYNTDVITVTYAGGNIQSVDERVLLAFDMQEVVYEKERIIINPVSGFEIYEDNFKFADCNGCYVGKKNLGFFRTIEVVKSGDGSMSHSGPIQEVNLDLKTIFDTQDIPAGEYEYSFYIWMDETATISTIRTIMRTPGLTDDFDITAIERGTWVKMTKVVTLMEALAGGLRIQVKKAQNPNAGTNSQKFYLDDFQLAPIVSRP